MEYDFEMEDSCGVEMENDSGRLQMENESKTHEQQ